MAEQGPPLLIVEDDEGLQSQLRWCFPDYSVGFARDRKEALKQFEKRSAPVVLLDLGLPPDPANTSEGMRCLEQILELAPGTKVVVVTGNDDRSTALEAVDRGAYDFYAKPADPEVLKLIVDRAHQLYALQQENDRLRQGAAAPLDGLVAQDTSMQQVSRMIERVAPSEATVLLLGESGTGKEILARTLHRLSGRSKGPFVAINCASIPENLLESELFGFEKGAFTGATRQRLGRIEHAHGGTLFLDEIGDLPHTLQPKLLRFLQERVIERLGGRDEIPVDVRVVGATHCDLAAMMRTGEFREDLYYRLAEITVSIPPLRERGGDAALLAHAFLRRTAQAERRQVKGFTAAALEAIQAYEWPGNVRELENVIRRAVILASGERLGVDDLGLPGTGDAGPQSLDLREARERAEQEVISRALGVANGNVLQAAELLGVSRPTLYALMEKIGLRGGER